MIWTCELCGRVLPGDQQVVIDHAWFVHSVLRVVDCWPDGELVVYDELLEPADFEDHDL